MIVEATSTNEVAAKLNALPLVRADGLVQQIWLRGDAGGADFVSAGSKG
jgi:hypothetical protein